MPEEEAQAKAVEEDYSKDNEEHYQDDTVGDVHVADALVYLLDAEATSKHDAMDYGMDILPH